MTTMRLPKNNFGVSRRRGLTPGPSPITGEGSNCRTVTMLNRRRGFTLLEVTLVSGLMVIFAMLLSSTWSGVGRPAADLIGRGLLVQERDLAIAALSRDLGGSLGDPNARKDDIIKGQWLRWDRPANVDRPLNTDLRLLYDGRTDPATPISLAWAAPNTIIRYVVESNTLFRWDELANTYFAVAKNVDSMNVTAISGRPDAFNIVLCFKYRKLTLTCNLTAEIP
jgi:prepilin-type N-terminal cleavage/methylation domain-containing protein